LESNFFLELEWDKNEEIKIDFPTSAVECFLKLAYSKNFDFGKQDPVDHWKKLNFGGQDLIDVWKISFQYDAPAIVKICETVLLTCVESIAAAVELVEMANLSTQLKNENIANAVFPKIRNRITVSVFQQLSQESKNQFVIRIIPVFCEESVQDPEVEKPTILTYHPDVSPNDLVLISNENCHFHIHRLLLALASKMFRTHKVVETKHGLDEYVTHYSTDACRELCDFLYNKTCRLSHVVELFELAEEYQITSLSDRCLDIITTEIKNQKSRVWMEVTNSNRLHEYPAIMTAVWIRMIQTSMTASDFKLLSAKTKNAFLCFHLKPTPEPFEVKMGDKWFKAFLIEQCGNLQKFHYSGWCKSKDEWIVIGSDRVRKCGTGTILKSSLFGTNFGVSEERVEYT
jgi:hypothetical protein